ncbi:MAG: hypothetical protein ACI4JQ_02050 [Ruminococcus sp.]
MDYKEKITLDLASAKLGRKELAIQNDTIKAVELFCEQHPEFRQAVEQGGSFADCLKHCVSGSGSAISDIEVFKRAAQFYFPEADVHFHMQVVLPGDTQEYVSELRQEKPVKRGLSVELDSLLDF